MAVPLLVGVGLVVAGQRLAEPASRAMLSAMIELGPIAGWRCSESAAYVYDPRRERPDVRLVREPPEALAPADVQVVRVEVDLRSGDATVWGLAVGSDPEAKPNRVVAVSPGLLRAVEFDGTKLCYSALAHWFIVGDHALE